MLRFSVLATALLAATPAPAQIIRAPSRGSSPPTTWVSFSIAAFSAGDVSDGRSSSTWDFGNSTSMQYRASIEKALQGNSTIGVVGTYVQAPLAYYGGLFSTSGCNGCSAHADLYSVMATFHAGGGLGFHQVIDASVGAHVTSGIHRDSDDAQLDPQTSNSDFGFTVGYGFGYGLSPQLQIALVQDFGLAVHERNGLSAGENNSFRMQATRLGVRIGFGQRSGTRKR
jgi:hypothetical protein